MAIWCLAPDILDISNSICDDEGFSGADAYQQNPEVPPFEPQNKVCSMYSKNLPSGAICRDRDGWRAEWQDYQRRRITGGTGSGGAAGEEDRGDRGADCRTQRTKVHIDCRPVVIRKDDVSPRLSVQTSGPTGWFPTQSRWTIILWNGKSIQGIRTGNMTLNAWRQWM